jgi:hypothetical protein
LLPLTLAWKIAIPPNNPNDVKDELVKFFERNSFDVVETNIMVNYDLPVMEATNDSCRLLITTLTPDGSSRDATRLLAGDTDRLFVVFRSNVYTQQPTLWTLLYYLWSRFLRELGLIRYITPAIAVVANSSCDTGRLPWGELFRTP